MRNDRFVKFISAYPQAPAEDNSRQRDNCNFASPAADIHDHIARWLMHRQPDSDGRGHRLLDQIHFSSAGMSRGIFYSPFFHLGDPRRDSNDHARSDQFPMMDLLNEVTQHRFRNFKISDDSVFHGPDRHDISGRASQHPLGFFAYGQDVGSARLNRDDRWFTQDNSSISHVNE